MIKPLPDNQRALFKDDSDTVLIEAMIEAFQRILEAVDVVSADITRDVGVMTIHLNELHTRSEEF